LVHSDQAYKFKDMSSIFPEGKCYRVLVAEDDRYLRAEICAILGAEGYFAHGVFNGTEALAALRNASYDLLLSDIHMPGMGGFELFNIVSKEFPSLQKVLVSEYSIDHYMDEIPAQAIGNVLIKDDPIDAHALRLLVRQLATRDIFGLARHMEPGFTMGCDTIRSPLQISALSEHLAELYGKKDGQGKLRTVLAELLTNAVFYGARNENGANKNEWVTDFELPPQEEITICHGQDSEKAGFSICDHGGRLDKKTLLYWLHRHMVKDENGRPQGLLDTHGRGLFITRKMVDRLLIHVDPGKCCECIILKYHKPRSTQLKPLHIIEL
jgi:CheY-like chemotaxis protein